MTTRPALLTPPFLWLTAAHGLQALGFSSMLLFPRYLDALGASRSQIGAIVASAALGGLMVRPAVGWALDTAGRKPTLTVGTLGLVAGMLGVGAVTGPTAAAYACQFVFGMGVGACFTGYFTFASDLVPASRRTEGLALFGVAGLLPLMVSPISARLGVDPMAVRWFLPAVGLVMLGSLACLAFVPEARVAPELRPRLSLGEVWAALKARPLWPVWLADVVFSGLVALFMAFALVVGAGRGLAQPTDVYWTYALGAAAVRVFGGSLPDRVGKSRMLPVSLGCYVAAVFALSLAQDAGGLLLAGLLAGVGHGYTFPILSAQTVARTPAHLRGSALALFTGIWDITKLTFPPMMGLVADLAGDTTMLRVAGGAGVLGLVGWGVLEAWVRPRPGDQRSVTVTSGQAP